MIPDLADLSPPVRAAAGRWLDDAVAPLDPAIRRGVREDLAAELSARLEASASEEDLAAVTASMGLPPVTDPADRHGEDQTLGARLARRWWDPTSHRILVPRLMGLGWDVNFGAVAVRLGLIEPDAEDVPFASTPDRAMRAVAALPLVLSAAVVTHYAVRGSGLPQHLPQHWDWRGEPDRWTTRRDAALLDSGMATAGAALALYGAAGSVRGARRAGALAAASTLSATTVGIVLLRTLGSTRVPWGAPALTSAALTAPAATLFALARAGRAAERDRDLSSGGAS